MIVAIASGKGGTGKTLVSTNLFHTINEQAIYADCDVEEPNGHLFLKPVFKNNELVNIPVPVIDESKCTHCGHCAEVCKFNALIVAKTKVLVFPELCHGCGSCAYFCPEKAIVEKPREIGKIEEGTYAEKTVFTGRLNIGEPMSPPIIRKLREKIDTSNKFTIIDSPPGTSCPVIASITGTDYVILVTEPTPFGLNDLKLAVAVVRKLKIPFGIVVNKSGLGGTIIKDYCAAENIKILLEIEHDHEIAEIYSRGELISKKDKYKKVFKQLYATLLGEIKK